MNQHDLGSAAEAAIGSAVSATSSLSAMTDAQVRKLYYRSVNVFVIGLLVCGSAIILSLGLFTLDTFTPDEKLLIGTFAAVLLIATVGIFMRSQWGRILGVLVCILSLLNFPIGTIVGAMGLFAFFGAPQLFGKKRIPHSELKQEFNSRKK